MTRHHRRWGAAVLAAAVSVAGVTVPANAEPVGASSFCTPGQLPIRGIRTDEKVVAFTFDDGPSDIAPQIMSMFEARGYTATFFLVARVMERRAAIVRDMVARGFEVGNHSFTHQYSGTLNAKELEAAQAKITSIAGVRPIFYRAPGLTWSPKILVSAGLAETCPIDTLTGVSDWKPNRAPPAELCKRFAKTLVPGAVVLLHDGGGSHANTLAALPCMLDLLAARGYRVVSLRDLLGRAGGNPANHVLRPVPKAKAKAATS